MNRRFLSKWDHPAALDREGRTAFRNEMRISYIAIAGTLIAILAFTVEGGIGVTGLVERAAWTKAAELVIGKGLIAFFLFSGLVYQLTRLGYLRRFARHRGIPASALSRIHRQDSPNLTILVPSYKEERRVVRQTLLSAVLQRSPNRRVVLLIDDPPAPRDREDAAKLASMRNLPREISSLVGEPCRKFEQALADVVQRQACAPLEARRESRRLARLLWEAAAWLDRLADDTAITDHNDALFVEQILRAPAQSHRRRAVELLRSCKPIDVLAEYRRLAALFKADITSFERKRYVNLSHEANKAMNLNSYIALMGKSFREVASPDGLLLVQTEDAQGTLRIPNADFLIVLDADSLILPEYSSRLIHFMSRPGNERVAVVQTPYASVPGAASMVERVAGATTDVQLMSHQGATLFGAGSWVGASALVRRGALDDIVQTVTERGHPVLVYVRDRTLNEDTDTTVDLIRKGWTLYNYPERLAYSATPADFGALLIQRRRWATGGVLIVPNVFRYFWARPSLQRLSETLIRTQYILSAPLGSVSVGVLMLRPFDMAWSATALPALLAYLFVFQRDLVHNGSRALQLFRAMALNAMLLPINLAGAINSLRQLWSGRKIPFQRTPKLQGRTAAAPVHIAAQFGLLLFAAAEAKMRYAAGEWLAFLFFAWYAAAVSYTFHVFIGWRAALEDALGGFELRLRSLRAGAVQAWEPRSDGLSAPARRFDPRRAGQRRAAGWTAAALCLCALTLSHARWDVSQSAEPSGIPPREAAVTFDDLPVISVTPIDAAGRTTLTRRLLAKISAWKVPVIGFVNEYGLYAFRHDRRGQPDQRGMSLLQMWLDAGLELGNHTFAHTDLHATSPAAFEADVVRGEAVTAKLLRRKGMRLRYFRHPYLHTGRDLATRQDVERFLAGRGYRVAPVTVDNDDYVFAAAYSKAAERGDAEMMRRLAAAYIRYTERVFDYSEGLSVTLFGREIKQIVLLHANALNADHFGELARMMKQRGYSFISLDAALGDEAYASADAYTGGESINWLARWAVTRGVKRSDNVLDDFPDVPDFVLQAAGTRG